MTINFFAAARTMRVALTNLCRSLSKEYGGRRFTYPHEVAHLVLLLASDRAANTTGANFTIDGGLITTT